MTKKELKLWKDIRYYRTLMSDEDAAQKLKFISRHTMMARYWALDKKVQKEEMYGE